MDERIKATIQEILYGQPPGNLVTGAVVAILEAGASTITTFARSGFASPFQPDGRFLLYSFTKTIVAWRCSLLGLVVISEATDHL
jgi:CubicO group peptidase (beta-lactamase class C family)